MNIFYLNHDPYVAAQMHTDKHVVKMVVETAQLLSTAHHVLDKNQAPLGIYKKTHENHPSAIWVRSSTENYAWTYSLFVALSQEYSKRFHRVHKTYADLFEKLQPFPKNIKKGKFTMPPCAMPDVYKIDGDSVGSYLLYYLLEKVKCEEDIKRISNFVGV